jgi:ferredoxin-NADP reductase
MPSYRIKLTKSEKIAEGTQAFHFTRPAGFEFQAGQTMEITLIDPPETDAEGHVRTFSIASPPFEDQLMIATRMRDTAFKRVLRRARPGLEVNVEGPGGSLTLHKNATSSVVFLTGGIGITPFLSIVRQVVKDKLKREIYLIDSNRRPEDAPFLNLLDDLAAEHPHFHFIPTMTKTKSLHSSWAGETGKVDAAMLSRHLPYGIKPVYYIAGPPGMVTAMQKALQAAKVVKEDIRSEDFSGY